MHTERLTSGLGASPHIPPAALLLCGSEDPGTCLGVDSFPVATAGECHRQRGTGGGMREVKREVKFSSGLLCHQLPMVETSATVPPPPRPQPHCTQPRQFGKAGGRLLQVQLPAERGIAPTCNTTSAAPAAAAAPSSGQSIITCQHVSMAANCLETRFACPCSPFTQADNALTLRPPLPTSIMARA